MNKIDIKSSIDKKNLSEQYYFRSLIFEAQRTGSLPQSVISQIHTELIAILSDQTDRLTKGRSSSIPQKAAEELLHSLGFVLGIKLKAYPTPESALNALKTVPLKELYDDGLSKIRRRLVILKQIHKKLCQNLMKTENIYYRATAIDGINGFFKLYRPTYAAHEIHITADYPICKKRKSLDGIEFIEDYLTCLDAENSFCILFDSDKIHALMCGLDADYSGVPVNIFEYVLLSALGLTILKKTPDMLDLTAEDVNSLYAFFGKKTKAQIKADLKASALSLAQTMELSEKIQGYIKSCLTELTETVQTGIKLKKLEKVFLIPSYADFGGKIEFSYGDQMDSALYGELIEKIDSAQTAEEKVQIILENIRSFADFLDIINDAELTKSEIKLLVNSLSPSEFALIVSRYPNGEFLERQSEKLLYHALLERVRALTHDEKARLKKMSAMLKNKDF